MHIIYQLSSSSMPSFQRCIELADQNNTENQWNMRFSRSSLLLGCDLIINKTEILNENKTQDNEDQEILNTDTDIKLESKTIDSEKYKEIIESNPLSHMNYILEESLKDELILPSLARYLSDMHIEKMCQYIFENVSDIKFIEKFLLQFLVTYLKRHNTRLSIDLLVKVHKSYPIQFKMLVQRIILDTEIDNTILQEFVSTLQSDEHLEILKSITDLDITVDVFIKNIFTIYTIYKGSLKDERVQNFIFAKLDEASGICVADKQYGRLLLTYLQNKNDNAKITDLQRVVEAHRSAFRRPCLNLLNEIVEKFSK